MNRTALLIGVSYTSDAKRVSAQCSRTFTASISNIQQPPIRSVRRDDYDHIIEGSTTLCVHILMRTECQITLQATLENIFAAFFIPFELYRSIDINHTQTQYGHRKPSKRLYTIKIVLITPRMSFEVVFNFVYIFHLNNEQIIFYIVVAGKTTNDIIQTMQLILPYV